MARNYPAKRKICTYRTCVNTDNIQDQTPIVNNNIRSDVSSSDSPIADILVIPGPTYPVSNSESQEQFSNYVGTNSSVTENGTYDVIFDNDTVSELQLDQIPQNTSRNETNNEPNTCDKAREQNSSKFQTSEKESNKKMIDSDNKLLICADSLHIDAGVNFVTIAEQSTHVDEQKIKQIRLEDFTNAELHEIKTNQIHIQSIANARTNDISMDGDITKMFLINRQETINPISQDVIDDTVFHEKLLLVTKPCPTLARLYKRFWSILR